MTGLQEWTFMTMIHISINFTHQVAVVLGRSQFPLSSGSRRRPWASDSWWSSPRALGQCLKDMGIVIGRVLCKM